MIQIYLFSNLLLVVGYFVVLAGMAFAANSPKRTKVLWAEGMFLMAILSPVAMSFSPKVAVPIPQFHQPAMEGGSSLEVRLAKQGYTQKAHSPEKPSAAWLKKIDQPSWIQLIMLLGFAIFSIRFLVSFNRLRRLLLSSSLVRSHGKVRVGISNQVQVPLSAWLFGRAWVLLPEEMLANRQDLKLALMHELQHHRQRDTVWAMVMEPVYCLFYLNPIVALWRRRIVELQEFSCDEALVGRRRVSPREYGSCLVRVASMALAGREVYAGTAYMAVHGGHPTFLRRRIEMLASNQKIGTHKWAQRALVLASLCLTFSISYAAEQAARELKENTVNPGKATTDPEIQKIADRILGNAIRAQKASQGFAIVADPMSGRILAVANVEMRGKKTGYWSLAQRMEPASIAKALVVAEALEENKTNPRESFFCEHGKYEFAGKVFHDWREKGFSRLTTTQTIARSSDICTVKIAERLGEEGVRRMLSNFGIGPSGSAQDFPGGLVGVLPAEEGVGKKFLVPYSAYGQGFQTTPLEVVQAFGAIANGGELLKPLQASQAESERKVVRRVLSVENAEKMKAILREVVLTGTAHQNGESRLYTTAGKTASSYSPDLSDLDWMGGTRKSNVAGFVGFAPVNDPRVIIYVGIQDPHTDNTGAHGSAHAAPVFRDLADSILEKLDVTPDRMN